MNSRNPYAKSCIRVYNTEEQVMTKEPEILKLEGIPQTYSGCSLTLFPRGVRVNKPGLYHFSADVILVPTGGAECILWLYLNGEPIPSAKAQCEPGKGPYTLHVETELGLNTCCMEHPLVTAVLEGVEGTVTHVSLGAIKLA